MTFSKTVHIIFPSAIRYVDLGSADLLAAKADGTENVLRVKAALRDFSRESNLSVITEDGGYFISVPEAVQVHHLIGIAVVGGTDAKFDEKWFKICYMLGYNINCAQNAVVLPSDMFVACHYEVPLHKGGHDATEVKMKQGRKHKIVQECYSKLVKAEVSPLKRIYLNALKNEQCADVDPQLIKDFHKDMFDISQSTFENVKNFRWFVSADAEHYRSGSNIGCYNLCRSIDGKMIEMAKDVAKKATENTRTRDFFFRNKDSELIKGCPEGRDHYKLGCRDKKNTPIKWEEARYDVMITDEELGIG